MSAELVCQREGGAAEVKRLMRMVLLCLLAAAVVMAASAGVEGGTPSPQAADEEQAVALLNADRAAHGLPPLRINPTLAVLARDYAQDMIDRGYFSHVSPEGEAFTDRLARYGVGFRSAGENLGVNGSVAAAERMLMNSPAHRDNILGKEYAEVGIGVRYAADGSVYVVQVFVGL
ncbi:CAP domain-containing protein [Anaeroselena agilis]|uniref:CAP domain-containing protein n=1 Tax=Anaeroselena agilis TaxID=3063788 RepID=A0ABU3P596_9FIRM|nr:CAP domain-containing protein [Selenomonadales bacterium 4137-cl]